MTIPIKKKLFNDKLLFITFYRLTVLCYLTVWIHFVEWGFIEYIVTYLYNINLDELTLWSSILYS